MASEIVSPTAEPALEAFTAYDSGVFLDWMEAIGDMMLSGSKPENLGPSTVASIGGLMYALTRAAQELGERERQATLARVRS